MLKEDSLHPGRVERRDMDKTRTVTEAKAVSHCPKCTHTTRCCVAENINISDRQIKSEFIAVLQLAQWPSTHRPQLSIKPS